MHRILVTGATGLLGQHVLSQAGDKFDIILGGRVNSQNTYTWQYYNLDDTELTLDLNDFDCVLHLASHTKQYKSKAEIAAIQLLIGAMKRAKVPHLIYISIVGVHQVPLPYFRTKHSVEQLIQASGIGYSILRSTQFYEFLESEIMKQLKRLIPIFPNISYQPIEAAVVARKLLTICHSTPCNKIIEIGGSEIISFKKAIRLYQKHAHIKGRTFGIPALFLGKWSGALTTPQMISGGLTWSDYLQQKYSGN